MKEAEARPALIPTDAGTIRADLFELRLTTVVLVAVCERFTVQEVLVSDRSVAVAHCRPETDCAATRETLVDMDEPRTEAAIVAIWSVRIVPLLTLKTALEAFVGIDTLGGTVRFGALELSTADTGPVEATTLRLNVQVLVALAEREVGVHARPIGFTIATAPPVAETGTALASADEPNAPFTAMENALAPVVTPTVTIAKLPLGIGVSLSPDARQVYEPTLAAHVKVLPTEVRATSALTVKLLTLAVGYVKVHCSAVGLAAPGLRNKFSCAVPAGSAAELESDKELVWPATIAGETIHARSANRLDRVLGAHIPSQHSIYILV